VFVYTGPEEKKIQSKKEKMKERRERWLSSESTLNEHSSNTKKLVKCFALLSPTHFSFPLIQKGSNIITSQFICDRSSLFKDLHAQKKV